MSDTYYKECQKCGYSASNFSSSYWSSECPRCGSSNYHEESSYKREAREERVSRQESESREESYRNRNDDSGKWDMDY